MSRIKFKNGKKLDASCVAFENNKTLSSFNILSSWIGKKIAFLGDSITAGVGTTKTYCEFLQENIGIIPSVFAISGNDMNDMLSRATEAYNTEIVFSAIFIFAGTNDFTSNVPIGDWYTEESVTIQWYNAGTINSKHQILSNDSSTFKGRINNLVSYIQTNFPDCRIFFLTPLHRGYYQTILPGDGYTNNANAYLENYVSVIKEGANRWGCNLINLYKNSGMNPTMTAHQKFFADNIHPNIYGHKRIADTIIGYLNTITPSK